MKRKRERKREAITVQAEAKVKPDDASQIDAVLFREQKHSSNESDGNKSDSQEPRPEASLSFINPFVVL